MPFLWAMYILRYMVNQLIPTPCKELPWLPNEVVYHIFEIAAASSKQTRRNLMLVSSSVRMIALRYMHNIISLDNFETFDYSRANQFPLEAFDSKRRLASPYTFTKYLCCDPHAVCMSGVRLFHRNSPTIVATILFHCTHLRSLCLGVSLLSDVPKYCDNFGPCDVQHPLELTLYMDMDGMAHQYVFSYGTGDFAQKFYRRVTHLHLRFANQLNHFNVLAYYPNVTHVTFYATLFNRGDIESVIERIGSWRSLQVIVIMTASESIWNLLPSPTLLDIVKARRKTDSRFLGAIVPRSDMEAFRVGCVEGSVWEQAATFSRSIGLIDE